LRIDDQVFKAGRPSPFGYWPLGKEVPILIEYLNPFVKRIGDVKVIGCGINCDRRRVVKLTVAIALAAPSRKYLTVRTTFDDLVVALVDNINRIIRPDSYSTGAVKSQLRSFPLPDELAIGR